MSSLLTQLRWGAAWDPWSIAITVHQSRSGDWFRSHYGRCDFACPADTDREVTLPEVSRTLFQTDEQAEEAVLLLAHVRAVLGLVPLTAEGLALR